MIFIYANRLISTGTFEEYVLQKQFEKMSLIDDFLVGRLSGYSGIKISSPDEAVRYKNYTLSVIHDQMACQKCGSTQRSDAEPVQANYLNRYLDSWNHYSTGGSSQRGPLFGVADCDEISFYMHRKK